MSRGFVAIGLAAVLACGCGKKETPKPPPIPVPAVTADAEWHDSLDGVAIPDRPATGRIHGRPFVVDGGELNEGVLKLRQGKAFFADLEIAVFLFTKDGELPAGRTWEIRPDKKFGKPHVHLGWLTPGNSLPEHDMFMGDYTMRLELGQEENRTIPGRIYVCTPDANRSWAAGTFRVPVKGFVLRNGVPDRTADSFGLLEWLAKEHLEKQNAGHAVKIEKSKDGQFMASGDGGDGSKSFSWTLDGADKGWLKFVFSKDSEWKVSGTFRPDQIPEAHPPAPLNPKEGVSRFFSFLAAREIEKSLAGKAVSAVNFSTSTSPRKFGTCLASYNVDGDQKTWKRTFAFRWTIEGWELVRELAEGEEMDLETGEVKGK